MKFILACKNLNLNHDNILKLASTKWNFLKFEPGLVGGHCLPVDPYYFSYICKKKKFNTRIALAGRYINDQMAYFVRDIIKLKLKKLKLRKKSKILLCGLSYKKNVADLRNSLAYKIFKMMKNKYVNGYDPLIDKITAKKNGLITNKEKLKKFDFYVILTEHDVIKKILSKINSNKIILPL